MCGIAGIIGQADSDVVGRLKGMVTALRHRGPDAQGLRILDDAALGHTRLSIIDLAAGQQPMQSADGRYWITFNGEIYNYRELRAELEACGQRFHTNSDTEVLLEVFIQYGSAGFSRLNGMFSAAIWDTREHTLWAARDRMGKKPFYFAELAKGGLAFASEPKALLLSGLVQGQIDLTALDAYLALGYVPSDRTCYSNIQLLPPAHYLTWCNGRLLVQRYWEPSWQTQDSLDEAEAAEELRYLVRRAVQYRMVADVPVGAFLSGGLDSSTVVALMQELATDQVKTFSVGFGDLIDELPYARAVAQAKQTDHHELQMDLPVADLLEEMARVYDEPFADSSNIPTYAISRFARDYVKVVLTGDGADEMFGGYDWWYGPLLRSEHASRSELALLILRLLTRCMTWAGRSGLPMDHTLQSLWAYRKAVESARCYPDPWDRHRDNVSYFTLEQRAALFRSSRSLAAPNLGLTPCASEVWGINRAFDFDVTQYLPGDILVKVDRAAMAVGLETRCPFLDPQVVEFALSLPVRLKIREGQGKYLFHQAFQRLWPDVLHNRKKHGFGAPKAHWLRRSDVRTLISEVVTNPTAPLGEILDMERVRSGTERFYKGESGMTPSQLWILLCLGLWLHQWRSYIA